MRFHAYLDGVVEVRQNVYIMHGNTANIAD